MNADLSSVEKEVAVQAITYARMASNAAIARKDVDQVARFWMNDFVQIAGDGSYSKGKMKIMGDWRSMFKHGSPVFERLPDEVLVAESGTMAWEKGVWRYKNEKYHGRYSAMWRKIKGEWLTQCEMYVSLNQ
ncbi:DUF4440 domain-containing protein [Pedobacter sp. SYSU D00535]|uniref:YybH family protein n=1 Tax=Pedobacter sp. SYSU D00535 TaxID=2810308 RepID=UPI001A963F4E|nr:DUF4440 domain-containing protein [Pedobacter sp. SYSU D00535]